MQQEISLFRMLEDMLEVFLMKFFNQMLVVQQKLNSVKKKNLEIKRKSLKVKDSNSLLDTLESGQSFLSLCH